MAIEWYEPAGRPDILPTPTPTPRPSLELLQGSGAVSTLGVRTEQISGKPNGRVPKDHVNIRILPTMISSIPLMLGPGARM